MARDGKYANQARYKAKKRAERRAQLVAEGKRVSPAGRVITNPGDTPAERNRLRVSAIKKRKRADRAIAEGRPVGRPGHPPKAAAPPPAAPAPSKHERAQVVRARVAYQDAVEHYRELRANFDAQRGQMTGARLTSAEANVRAAYARAKVLKAQYERLAAEGR